MLAQDSLLVTLVKLIDRFPQPVPAMKRGRGRPQVYSDRLFLKALVIMIVRHLHTVHELLSVLAQPMAEMSYLRERLSVQGSFPARRTWERRFKALPATLPTQIGCLGRLLIELLNPWEQVGRAVAIDSTILRSRGAVWHQKHRQTGSVPHTLIDTEAHWTRIGLAWMGLRLEVARRFGGGRHLVSSGCLAYPCERWPTIRQLPLFYAKSPPRSALCWEIVITIPRSSGSTAPSPIASS